MNVTIKQKIILFNLLKENAELVRGRIDRKGESKRKLKDMWNVIAENINKANEGPEKNGQEWAKTWEDIKAYIFKKEAKRRSYAQGTGGGPPSKVSFSSFDEDVLQLLTPEAAGLENIPEGGLINIVEEVQPLQECDYQNTMQEQDIQCSVIETDEIENVSTNVNIRQHSRKNETVTQEKNTRKGGQMA
ncbi:PREDICTED: uncharacterized protein LOC108769977, partial [Trachymyrmex cornetzi]|uniref:uncharacterized protein LOC108769977 n=1 Tax=Trachymyrmex cornetzi TaxID=471704 RepID=UPI00084F04E8